MPQRAASEPAATSTKTPQSAATITAVDSPTSASTAAATPKPDANSQQQTDPKTEPSNTPYTTDNVSYTFYCQSPKCGRGNVIHNCPRSPYPLLQYTIKCVYCNEQQVNGTWQEWDGAYTGGYAEGW